MQAPGSTDDGEEEEEEEEDFDRRWGSVSDVDGAGAIMVYA
jgi:hypothetical protein